MILHITNGDSVIPIMQEAGIEGAILPWRDVLHEGPVPSGLSLTDLSSVRADFISGSGWEKIDVVRESFRDRDGLLQRHSQFEKVILWFEQDLYDQLQLLQILDWFNQQNTEELRLYLIQADYYLGMMQPPQLAKLMGTETAVTSAQLQLAARAWQAFTADNPHQWVELLDADTSVLPYLQASILRLLEEFPSCRNGLSRTQQQALTAIESGESRPGHVFGLSQEMEQYRFMGDTTFWFYLNQMLQCQPPLLTLPVGKQLSVPVDASQILTLTREGLEVLHGQQNWLQIHEISRWIGGVHLRPGHIWCWDSDNKMLRQL